MVINSPNSANLITAPVPGAGKPRPAAERTAVQTQTWCIVSACGGCRHVNGTQTFFLAGRSLPLRPCPRCLFPFSLLAAEGEAAKPAEDAPAFMRRAWGLLLAAVLPLWRDPALLAAHGDKIVQASANEGI